MPKTVYVSRAPYYQGYVVKENNDDTKYIRADLVQPLVDALCTMLDQVNDGDGFTEAAAIQAQEALDSWDGS